MKGKVIPVHRLVAMEKFGLSEIPKGLYVHHINGNSEDNRPENLTLVSPRMNAILRKDNNFGESVGSSFNRFHNRYESYITIKGIKIHLGYFNTMEKAHTQYLETLINLVMCGIVEV